MYQRPDALAQTLQRSYARRKAGIACRGGQGLGQCRQHGGRRSCPRLRAKKTVQRAAPVVGSRPPGWGKIQHQDRGIIVVGESGLDENLKAELAEIDEPVNIKVFVTLTCPHCPQAVETAHKFAIENPNITSEMVESQEFMDLAQQFGVRGVPQVNINDEAAEFTGAQPPQQFLEQVKAAL